jgi:hypothetical protein
MSVDFNNFSLTAEQLQQLVRLSVRTGKSPSQLVDQLLHQYSEPNTNTSENGGATSRTLYDAFAEDGSLGMIQDGPSDMSTNPDYMKGFGQSGG